MTARPNITPPPLSGAALARAVSDWLKLGASVEITPEGNIKVKAQGAANVDALNWLHVKKTKG
jgi:hypothetical protein